MNSSRGKDVFKLEILETRHEKDLRGHARINKGSFEFSEKTCENGDLASLVVQVCQFWCNEL